MLGRESLRVEAAAAVYRFFSSVRRLECSSPAYPGPDSEAATQKEALIYIRAGEIDHKQGLQPANEIQEMLA